MPVAMISTSTSPAFGPFEVDLDDLERLLGFERDGGAGLHCCVSVEETCEIQPPTRALSLGASSEAIAASGSGTMS